MNLITAKWGETTHANRCEWHGSMVPPRIDLPKLADRVRGRSGKKKMDSEKKVLTPDARRIKKSVNPVRVTRDSQLHERRVCHG